MPLPPASCSLAQPCPTCTPSLPHTLGARPCALPTSPTPAFSSAALCHVGTLKLTAGALGAAATAAVRALHFHTRRAGTIQGLSPGLLHRHQPRLGEVTGLSEVARRSPARGRRTGILGSLPEARPELQRGRLGCPAAPGRGPSHSLTLRAALSIAKTSDASALPVRDLAALQRLFGECFQHGPFQMLPSFLSTQQGCQGLGGRSLS